MPIGSLSIFPEVVRIALLNNPKRVLDVGIGYGINGAGIKNWFYDFTRKEIELVGVEPWKQYDNPLWGCYNKIFHLPIEDFDYGWFDLIVMTDVIEHFEKEEGKKQIDRLKKMLTERGTLLISTPAIFFAQGAWEGNEYENHKSAWTVQDFRELGFSVIRDGKPDHLGHQMILVEFINK